MESSELYIAENCTSPKPVSNVTSKRCSSDTSYIGYMYVITPMTCVGIILNIINQVIFYRHRTSGSTMFYLYVLAIVDMTCLVVVTPIGATRCLPISHAPWEIWARGIYEAYIYLPLSNMFGTTSVWITTILSLDRYKHISSSSPPRRMDPAVDIYRMKLTVSVISTSAIIINMPYFFIKQIDDKGYAVETEFPRTLGYQIYSWIRMFMVKIFPILIVSIANFLLIKILVLMNRKRKKMVFPNTAQARNQLMQIRVSAMLVSILVVFLACHIMEPLSHSSLYGAIWGVCSLHTESHYTQIMITNALEWFSYASNFIFYCIFHKQFQTQLRQMCYCCGDNPKRPLTRGSTFTMYDNKGGPNDPGHDPDKLTC